MEQCPICRAPWPFLTTPAEPRVLCPRVVCPACWNCFLSDPSSGRWEPQPPRALGELPPPIPIDTRIVFRNAAYRVAGFACYSQSVEHGREQWQTEERHEYTLMPEEGGLAPLLLGWDNGVWWMAWPKGSEPVVASPDRTEVRFAGRTYKQKFSQLFTPDRAVGLLPFGFTWTSNAWLYEYVSGREAPGGHLILGERNPQRSTWVGEYLETREVAQGFSLADFPEGSPYRIAAPPAPAADAGQFVTAHPHGGGRTGTSTNATHLMVAVTVAVLAIAALGFFFYSRERRSKPDVTHWISCPVGPPEAPVFRVPRGVTRIVVDPHLPQGAIRYQLRFVDPAGAVLSTHDGFLDMSHAKRVVELEPPAQATALQVASCSLTVPIAGLRAWPVEFQMFGPLLKSD